MDDNLIIRVLIFLVIIFVILFIYKFSKLNKAKRKKYLLGTFIFICIWLVFFSVDFIRAKNQKSPIFCPLTLGSYINDGGSVMYYGLGYKVIHFNRILSYEERIDLKSGSANYYYICSWYPSYDTAWTKIKDKAIEYSYNQYKNNQMISNDLNCVDLSNLKQYIGEKIENTKAIEMLNIIKDEYNMYLANATETGEKNSVGLIIYFSDDIEKNADEITKNEIIDLIDSYIETREYDKDYGYFNISTGTDSNNEQYIRIYKLENKHEKINH